MSHNFYFIFVNFFVQLIVGEYMSFGRKVSYTMSRWGCCALNKWVVQVVGSIIKCIFLNENVWISIKILLKFVPNGPINNIPALALSHYLNQWWSDYRRVHASLGHNELSHVFWDQIYVFFIL